MTFLLHSTLLDKMFLPLGPLWDMTFLLHQPLGDCFVKWVSLIYSPYSCLFLVSRNTSDVFCMFFQTTISAERSFLCLSVVNIVIVTCWIINYQNNKHTYSHAPHDQNNKFTLLCGIIVLHILLIFGFFPCLHSLFGTARLLILLKNSYLHVYLELKLNCFRENLSISLDIWLWLDPITCLIHLLIQLFQYLTF